jgi:hypothetical protein
MNFVNGIVRRRSLGLHELGSDTGWGCMIRTGQTLLANALLLLRKGRDWRRDDNHVDQEEEAILALFRDTPDAPFSIHRIVAHGYATFQKDVDEWFAPSEVASAIKFLSEHADQDFFATRDTSDEDACTGSSDTGVSKRKPAIVSPNVREQPLRDLRVYNGGNDVYENVVFDVARRNIGSEDGAGEFIPTLILLRLRLGGGDTVNPVYYNAIKAFLRCPQSVGIAGGRPRSSYYFYGYQGDRLLYLNPHTEKKALEFDEETGTLGLESHAEVHTRRIDALRLTSMDPTMLVGFLVRNEDEYYAWKTYMQSNCANTISISSLQLDESSEFALENSGSDDDFVTVTLPGRRSSQAVDVVEYDSLIASSLGAVEEGESMLSTTEEDRLYADAVAANEPVVISRQDSMENSASPAAKHDGGSGSCACDEVSSYIQPFDDTVMVASPSSEIESVTSTE